MANAHGTLEKLMAKFLATLTELETLESIDENDGAVWSLLARQLRIPASHLQQHWSGMPEERKQGIWISCIQTRIENTAAHSTFFRDTTDRVTNKAMDKLEAMMDGGMIRNPAELMAIAKMRQPLTNQNTGHTVINNFGGTMRLNEGQTLPGGEGVMTISLSPRLAASLQRPQESKEHRVIDAEMLGVAALRSLNLAPTPNDSEPANDPDAEPVYRTTY